MQFERQSTVCAKDHAAAHTKGGMIAHCARRLFHTLIIPVAFFYYYFLMVHVPQKILSLGILAMIFFIFLFEKLRIRAKLVLFGQRLYEAARLSAFAWTMLSLGIVLLILPVQFAMPIVVVCGLVDPLLGEMRLRDMNKKMVFCVGCCAAWLIWFVAAQCYHFAYWYGVILAPVTVAAEWPSLKWIDDNALMMLVPLLGILLFTY